MIDDSRLKNPRVVAQKFLRDIFCFDGRNEMGPSFATRSSPGHSETGRCSVKEIVYNNQDRVQNSEEESKGKKNSSVYSSRCKNSVSEVALGDSLCIIARKDGLSAGVAAVVSRHGGTRPSSGSDGHDWNGFPSTGEAQQLKVHLHLRE